MNTRPTIVFVRQRYRSDGGAERFMQRVIEGLRGKVQPVVLARSWPETPGVRIVTCDPAYIGRLWRDAGFERAARRMLAGLGASLVQSHERLPGCDVYRAGDGLHATWLRERARVQGPIQRLATRLSPYHAALLRRERRLFRHSGLRAVICNSRMVRDEIIAAYGTPPDRIHVVYNAVDLERFHPRNAAGRDALRRELGIPPASRVVLFVGSGFERKGLGYLIEALVLLPAPVHLVVAGNDKRHRRYEHLAQSLGVGARIRFLGAVQDVAPLHGAADVFALPSLYDPFPNSALEAMASGLPVVVGHKTGAIDLVRADEHGFVVVPWDIRGLSEALERSLAPGARERLGGAARAAVEPYTEQYLSDRLGALYDSLLGTAP